MTLIGPFPVLFRSTGREASATAERIPFAEGLLDCPRIYAAGCRRDGLFRQCYFLSGNHAEIPRRWRGPEATGPYGLKA